MSALHFALAGVIVIGLAATAFHYLDAPTERLEPMGGTVLNMWRERGGYTYCQIRLSDGLAINQPCESLPVGAQVVVERSRRRLSRRVVYLPLPQRDR